MPKASLEKAFLKLTTEAEMRSFMQDLCSDAEYAALKERWLIVQLLDKGYTYRQIAEQLSTSTTTVTRVAKCLNRPGSGYKIALHK